LIYSSSNYRPDAFNLSVPSYEQLDLVQDGTQAQQAYFDIIGETLDESAKNKIIKALREYCKLDTLAMVEIVRKLSIS